MRGARRRPYASLDEVLARPEIVSYLATFDAWLAAGTDRNTLLVDGLKDVCAQDLIGAHVVTGRPCPSTPEHRLIADVLWSLREEAA